MSNFDFEKNRERLRRSADRLRSFDAEVVTKTVNYLGSDGPLRVLDVGCGDGYPVRQLFGDSPKIQLLGIDLSKPAIAAAKKEKLPNMEFRQGDIDELLPDLGEFDFILGLESLQHLERPAETLRNLWQHVAFPGALLVRSADDGMKFNYPTNDDLDFLLTATPKLPGVSDRNFGHRVPELLQQLDPEPILVHTDFFTDNTAGMDEQQRLEFFDAYYLYRRFYAEAALKNKNAAPEDIDRANRIKETVRRQREIFRTKADIISLSMQMTTVAYR